MTPQTKIYHIAHMDRLFSIAEDGYLWCDARMTELDDQRGTTIGMSNIKRRRMEELRLSSHPDLHVGDCVPFYFCPRSVMLYVISRGNDPQLGYRGGQDPIVHLEADLEQTVAWADANNLRWAFTTSNAGSRYFEDFADLAQLDKVDWNAVHARNWQQSKEAKQAEFLIEGRFPWTLVSRIGVISQNAGNQALATLEGASSHMPNIQVTSNWYY